MSDGPEIQRKVPIGPVTTAPVPVPVTVEIWWNRGAVDEVPALATAWTSDAVHVFWEYGEKLRGDWLAAEKVHRSMHSARSRGTEPPDRKRQ